jgi:hypothetical protein
MLPAAAVAFPSSVCYFCLSQDSFLMTGLLEVRYAMIAESLLPTLVGF